MKVVAIVQARMSSARLPGKVLADLSGRPVLGWVTDGLSLSQTINEVVIATSIGPSDNAIARWCADEGLLCFRGSLTDVLTRFAEAADKSGAEIIVRITGDCPLLDPKLVDQVVCKLINDNLDYCAVDGEFPDGLDCEAMTIEALRRANKEAKLASEREHVTPYLKREERGFRAGTLEPFVGLDHHRWTVDQPEDLAFLRAVLARCAPEVRRPSTEEILAILEDGPDLCKINSSIVRNEGYARSLEEDYSHDLQS